MQRRNPITLSQEGSTLTAHLDQQAVSLQLSAKEFWTKYDALWSKAGTLPLNQEPLFWQGQLVGFSEEEIRTIRQFCVLHRLQMREQYPYIPDTFSQRCLRSGVVRTYVLHKAGQKYGPCSEAAIRLTTHLLNANLQSIRTLIAVKRSLEDH